MQERQLLDREAERTGRSLSALIRDAVELAYGPRRSPEADLQTMRQTFGSWAGHGSDGETYVEALRTGSRWAPLV